MRFINPVYKRELKQMARMHRMVILIFCYNALLALFGLFSFYVTFHSRGIYRDNLNYANILIIYAIITGIEFILVLFLVPALTSSAISGEREKQTLDIMLTTKLTPFQIVLGKLLASISIMILLAVSSLPIISIVFSIGGITFLDLIKFMILIVVTAIYVGSIAILISTYCKKTTAATVASYSVMLLITIGSIATLFGISLLKELGKEEIYYNMATFLTMCGRNIGKFIYLLLTNPIFSFLSMLRDQTGVISEEAYVLIASGGMSRSLMDDWFTISLLIQLFISSLFLCIAARRLNPCKKTRKIKKIKNRQKTKVETKK